ncbi:MAG: hypothetical protein AAGL11_02660 [Pseudomonadota bacterium]
MKNSNVSFYTQILTRALNELESACRSKANSEEFDFYKTEAPIILEEAREALSALKSHLEGLELPPAKPPNPPTRH